MKHGQMEKHLGRIDTEKNQTILLESPDFLNIKS